MTPVARELENARLRLLDLTLRNRLLNYRPSAARSIRVIGELPAEIYDALVLRAKALEFRGLAKNGVAPQADVWAPETTLEARHTDRFLQTPYDDESLGRKLFRVYHEGRSAVEEQGYTVAHLAIGFLEWFESDDSDQPRRAPLLLIPAELERVRAGDFSKVRWTGEDVFANISLAAKLVDFGVALPPFEAPEEKSGIDAWLQRVVEAIARRPRWRVLSELTLDFFSFTKFVMFKDLDPATWPDERKPHDHALLRTLFLPSGEEPPPGFDADEIDEKLTARDLWHVMDADPSQIAAIEDVKAGRNLVVQGPPGTGKSQTITNLIAETLAAGRTVLFVSEKMAALEVVKSRLDAAGLGPFCLELHSRKSNKKAVLAELQRSLEWRPLAALPEPDEHEVLKRDLNRFVDALRSPTNAWQRTPVELFAMREAALAQLGCDPFPKPVPIANAELLRDADVTAAESALRELAYILPAVQPLATHPFRTSTRRVMTPQDEHDVRAQLVTAREATRIVIEAAAVLARDSGVHEPASLADVARAASAAEVMAGGDGPTEATLLLANEWNAVSPIAEELVARVEAVQRERHALARIFRGDVLETGIARELNEFGTLATRFFRVFNGRYRALRRQLVALYAGAAPKPPQMIADLSRLAEHQSVCAALRGDPRGRAFFGARWLADRSDCAALRRFAEWIVVFRRELLAEALTRRAVELAAARVDATVIRARIESLLAAAASCRASLYALAEALGVEVPAEEAPFATVAAQVEAWQAQLPLLFRWTQCNAARETLRATPAAALEPLVLADAIAAERLLAFFRLSLAESLLRDAFVRRPILGQFIGELHEKKIERFRTLDGGLAAIQRARLSRRLHTTRPRIPEAPAPHSEAGILLGEILRRRGHMSIRKLLTKAGGIIRRIKPCFLMSPLSIAQFLDPRNAPFDLIVFDEASQVRPEDALGAFLRGSQVVVMGDTQQLPPTNFFDHLAAGDDAHEDEVEAAAMTDVESILHQCARSFPTKTLQWHYRSRHESLIAISNLYFYENKLRIYPSATDRSHELGLQFVHLPRSIYDVGKSRMNRIEAQAVAAAALDHFRRTPDKSLGIGTFNIQQQQAIQEELELQLRAHPELDKVIADAREPLFVKNLETIQGDERDTILISLGYGRDAQGKLSQNFGPINREGGERRLNVLISRARERCVVFANFTAQDLVVDATSARGLRALQAFLEFAQTRRLPAQSAEVDEEESAFEDAVARALEERGFEVRRRVGCAGFRVDLAIVNPSEPGRYLLGIECDGAKYCDARVARDRDRLRQQMLEQLGWSIHRFWSIDWYRDRDATIARMVEAIEAAKLAPRVVAPRVLVALPVVEEVHVEIAPQEDAPKYEVCRELRIPTRDELHLVAPELLAKAVEDVVRVEGPVHMDEVVRRIRTIWGLQRAGNRIREAVEQGVRVALRTQCVARDGEFLRVPNAPVLVRRRNGDPPARVELISDAELAEALHVVLRTEFATPREELIDAAARRVGIQQTTSAVASRLNAVIDGEARQGRLAIDGAMVRPTRT